MRCVRVAQAVGDAVSVGREGAARARADLEQAVADTKRAYAESRRAYREARQQDEPDPTADDGNRSLEHTDTDAPKGAVKGTDHTASDD